MLIPEPPKDISSYAPEWRVGHTYCSIKRGSFGTTIAHAFKPTDPTTVQYLVINGAQWGSGSGWTPRIYEKWKYLTRHENT